MKIKVTTPSWPANKNIDEYTGTGNTYKDSIFYINSHIDDPDVWFITDFLYNDTNECSINSNNIFFLSCETGFFTKWWEKDNSKSFLNNFSKIFTFYDIPGNNVYRHQPFQYWTINGFHGFSDFEINNYGIDFYKKTIFQKDKKLSTIHAERNNIPGHKRRLDFLYYLEENLEDFDWFGSSKAWSENIKKHWAGEKIPGGRNKIDFLKRYKYNIAIENNIGPDIFSEKIIDSFLSLSYPIYFGATNIDKYFPMNSYININIDKPKESLEKIKEILNSNYYEENFDHLLEARDLCLTKYNLIDRIYNLAKENFVYGKKEKIKISPDFKCHFGED